MFLGMHGNMMAKLYFKILMTETKYYMIRKKVYFMTDI